MNVVEHWIREIHSVVPYEDLLIVEMTVNCYGTIERTKQYFLPEVWDEIKKKGYYLA